MSNPAGPAPEPTLEQALLAHPGAGPAGTQGCWPTLEQALPRNPRLLGCWPTLEQAVGPRGFDPLPPKGASLPGLAHPGAVRILGRSALCPIGAGLSAQACWPTLEQQPDRALGGSRMPAPAQSHPGAPACQEGDKS